MNGPADVPAQEVYDLLASGNFAPTGRLYESGEYWANSDRGMHLPIPNPVDGRLPLTVYEHIAAYIDRLGL